MLLTPDFILFQMDGHCCTASAETSTINLKSNGEFIAFIIF